MENISGKGKAPGNKGGSVIKLSVQLIQTTNRRPNRGGCVKIRGRGWGERIAAALPPPPLLLLLLFAS